MSNNNDRAHGANEIAQIAQIAGFAYDTKKAQEETLSTPIIPKEVYEQLPEPLKGACEVFAIDRERDVFFTAAITVLSGCFNNVSGLYAQKEVYTHLFATVVANAASGKGVATFAKQLAMPLHNALLNSSSGTEVKKLLFIPANSSSAAVIKHMENNEGTGIIFETETDTLNNTLKQDWGGYSDLLRKAYHHEAVTYSRKMNNEHVEIQLPKLSLFLSGTPGQIRTLIPSTENGLMSRLIFYVYSVPRVWKDVSSKGKPNLTEHFRQLSEQVVGLVDTVKDKTISFDLADKQWDLFNEEFHNRMQMLEEYDDDAVSSVLRLGLIAFRIAMLLTVIRTANAGNAPDHIVCCDIDFNTALTLSAVYTKHMLYTLDTLPKALSLGQSNNRLLTALPNEFTRVEAVQIGKQLGMGTRSIDDQLSYLIGKGLTKVQHGRYKKD